MDKECEDCPNRIGFAVFENPYDAEPKFEEYWCPWEELCRAPVQGELPESEQKDWLVPMFKFFGDRE